MEKDKNHLEWWAAEKAAYAAKRIALGHTDHEKAATEQHDDDKDSMKKTIAAAAVAALATKDLISWVFGGLEHGI